MPIIEGQILEGKYEVRHLIARGGIGEVYLGVNRRLGKNVAIKVLLGEHAREPAVVERFEQEARVAAMIRSAHIADVYDLGDLKGGERFIVMELLEGENLGDRLEREKRIPEDALAAMTLQILDALASAHEAGVVHRDLKPENLVLTKRDGRDFVKVVDFGISKVVTGGHSAVRRLTLAGVVLGTPLYMSPEQARGKALDHRSDLYSLGVVLYEAALGEPPFAGDNVNDVLFKVALDHVTPLELRLPSVSPALAAIVSKAMARAPGDRFQSAAEMRDAVLEWQAMLVAGSAARASIPSFAEGAVAGHAPTPTPRPWSITQPDEDDADVELDLVVPRRRSKGRFVAFAMLCGLVAYGGTHPQQVRTVSDEVALRAVPLWRAAESKASSAIAPPPKATAPATASAQPATTAEPPALAPPAAPPAAAGSTASPPPAVTTAPAAARTGAPKPLIAPPRTPRATGKAAAPEKKAAPARVEEEPPHASEEPEPDMK